MVSGFSRFLLTAILIALAGAGVPIAGATAAPAPRRAPAAAAGFPTIDTLAKHAYMIEADTGAVLLDKLGDEPMPPASMSKMMTAYIVFGLLKDGQVKLDDKLPVSEEAWRLGGSKMFVRVGDRVSIGELIQGMIVQSGNDACLVLAQGLAGSEQAFVRLMNEKARQLGLKHSHFANPTGLPDPDEWMSAHDLALLALDTIKNFPQYYHYYSEINFTYDNIKQGNRNPLLYKNIGADGLKTGHTDEAGYALTASVKRGNRRIILVLGGLPTMRSRGTESERLIEWGFRTFDNYRLFTVGDTVDNAEVWLGAQPTVPLTVTHDLVVTLPRAARRKMKVTADYEAPLPAPVEKGERDGKVVVTAPGVASSEVSLMTAASVRPIGTLGRMATVAGYLIWGNPH